MNFMYHHRSFLFQEDNIKVAFAEGYLAAKDNDESPKTGKTLKYLKVNFL